MQHIAGGQTAAKHIEAGTDQRGDANTRHREAAQGFREGFAHHRVRRGHVTDGRRANPTANRAAVEIDIQRKALPKSGGDAAVAHKGEMDGFRVFVHLIAHEALDSAAPVVQHMQDDGPAVAPGRGRIGAASRQHRRSVLCGKGRCGACGWQFEREVGKARAAHRGKPFGSDHPLGGHARPQAAVRVGFGGFGVVRRPGPCFEGCVGVRIEAPRAAYRRRWNGADHLGRLRAAQGLMHQSKRDGIDLYARRYEQ